MSIIITHPVKVIAIQSQITHYEVIKDTSKEACGNTKK